MSNSNEMSSVATEDGSIGTEGMRLWKVVTVIQFSNDRWLVLGLYIAVV